MKVDVLGIGFDSVTVADAVSRALSMIGDGRPHYIVTPNPEILYKCTVNDDIHSAVRDADLILADGIGVVRASNKLGRPLPERVAGFDFANSLLPELAKRGLRLFMLGSKPGLADKAAENLRKSHSGLLVCGTNDGYFKDDGQMTYKIVESGADVVFVCLGAPKQELWMAKNIGNVGHAVMVGLGGSIDHWAGVMKRAPLIFRKLGLEWLYRFVRYPSRLGRAFVIPKFLAAVKRQAKEERQYG